MGAPVHIKRNERAQDKAMITKIKTPLQRVTAGLTAGVIAACLLTACQVQVTPDGPAYTITGGTYSFTATNTNSGSNEREFIYAAGAATETNSSECETWQNGQGITQNGVAFHAAQVAGGWDGVVLERNIWDNAYWEFVIIYFHTADPGNTFTVGQEINLGSYLGESTATDVYPLSICANITGDTLSFAIAKQGDTMPALGTVGQGGTITLDASEYPAAGMTASYIGHIPPGDSAQVTNISVDGTPTNQATNTPSVTNN